METQLKTFAELNTKELYKLLQLRNQVFVVEQQCDYQDLDDKDQGSWHLMFWDNGVLIGYTRILPPGLAYELPAIGRVVIAESHRGRDLGKKIMHESIAFLNEQYLNQTIKIMAQSYLNRFYSELGFETTSKEFMEDGLPHVYMELRSY